MAKLIRFEFRKLFQNKPFYICLAISLVMIIIITLTYKVLAESLVKASEELGVEPPNTTFTSLSMLKDAFANGSVALVGGVMTTLIVAEDYVNEMTKNIYSKGYSREQLYIAKYISGLVAFLLLMLVGMVGSFLFGLALDGLGEMGDNYVVSILLMFLVGIAYYTIYFGVTILIKRTGGAIAICVLSPTVINLVLVMGDTFLKLDEISLSDYWLESNVTALAKFDVDNKTIIISIVVSIVMIIAMSLSSFLVNRKRNN